MSKREREITLLYGMSIIRDDILNHPLPKVTAKDRALIAAQFLINLAAMVSLIMPVAIMILTLIPYIG